MSDATGPIPVPEEKTVPPTNEPKLADTETKLATEPESVKESETPAAESKVCLLLLSWLRKWESAIIRADSGVCFV